MQHRGRAWPRFGIRQKVILTLSLVLLITLTLSGWLLLEKEKREFLAGIEQRGGDISGYVARSLAFSVVGYDYHAIQLLLDEVAATEDVAFARVTNANGKSMGVAGEALGDGDMRLFEQAIVLNEEIIGRLELGLDIRAALQTFAQRSGKLLWIELLVILIVVLGEFIALSLIIVRPVRRITTAIEGMAHGDAGNLAEIATGSRDEFGIMAHQFNELSRRLRESHEKLQSKVEIADRQLVDKNRQLLKQSNELRRINDELRKLTITDELTGLYNRRHFDEHLAKEVALARRYNQPTSLLLVDLDHFKRVNDSHGHIIGDEVLRQFSQRLQQRIRESDVLCRIGGEEFAVLCKQTGRRNATELAEQLRQTIEADAIAAGDVSIAITVSIGVATIPDPNRQAGDKELFACADRALYWSKQHGRNRIKHCQDMDDVASALLSDGNA